MTEHGMPPDTSPAALAVQADLYRRMTTADKARRVQQLTEAANTYALAGLRQRHPSADYATLLLHLAVLRLGPTMVARAYDWRPPRDGS